METIIFVRYGELSLKGKNKNQFKNCLYINIKNALKEFKTIKIIKEYDNIQILNIADNDVNKIIEIIKSIPGISIFYKAINLSNTNIDEICKIALSFVIPGTFKIEAKRLDKSYQLNSMEINCRVGGYILKNINNSKVDVHKPNTTIGIEIHHNKTIIYGNKILGFGGFPVGINGKVLILISGGIDSPVAAKLLMKKGFHVDFLTFITPPHTSDKALEKVYHLVDILTINNKLEIPRLFICNFTELQHEISHISNHQYQINIMRRYFFRIAQSLAKKYEYDAIATGESLGQVASQTISSMTTISSVLNNLLVLRPLLTYDKIEIINLAKKIGTYETSILPYDDACSLFVPNNPVTKPNIDKALKLEKELDLIEYLYNKTLEKNIVIKEYKKD